MSSTFAALLAAVDVAQMDGGMGSTLEDRGLAVRNPLWSAVALLDARGRALNDRVHADFAREGAEVLIANTHNASRAACAELLGDPAAALIEPELRAELDALDPAHRPAHLARFVVREALASARRAAPGAVVAGAVMNAEGAYAETSRLSADEAEAAIGPHAELCAEHGADVVIFEVVSTRSDLEAAARVGRRLARAGTPWALGLTTRADGATHAGVTMDEVARVVGSEPPIATFIQCTRFDLVTAALGPLVGALGGTSAVGVYANDGRRWIDRRWHGERVSELEYVQHAVRWRALGARVIGGCCGTSPDHVCALAILTGARRRASPGRARPR